VGQDEGAASAVVVQPVTNQSGQIACRWCGLFSDPGPACDLCGSPLLEVPWLQVPQLMYRPDASIDSPQIIAPAAPPEAPAVALPPTQPAGEQPAPVEEAIQIAAPPMPGLDAESEEAQRRALLGRLWPREPSLDADVDDGPAGPIIDVDLNGAPRAGLEETPAQPKPRWWRRGRKDAESDEEMFDGARTESLPEIAEQVPLPPAAGDASTPSEERASGGEKRSIIETVGSLADFEGEAADQAELQEQLRQEEEARLRAEELARLRAHEEARLKAEQEAVLKAELEARLRAEEKARLKAEEEARAKAEEETRRLHAEEQARLQAEEAARLQAEEEARLQAEEVARLQAEEEARAKAETEARAKAETEARAKAEEQARAKAEEQARADEKARATAAKEAKLRAKEEARIRAEAETEAAKAAEEARLRAEEAARLKAGEEARVRAEEQARAEEEARLAAEAEELARAKAEEEAGLRAQEAARVKAEEAARIKAEEEARARAEEEVRAQDRATGQPDDVGLRASLMQEMLGLGAERGASNMAADASATRPSMGAPAWSDPSTARSVPNPQPQPEEKKRSKLPWKKSKRKRDETEGAGRPATVPIGTSAAPRFQVPAVAPSNGAVYEVPPAGDPALAAPGAVFLVCSRCGQPSPGGGLCEACDDALSQLRQLTAALLDAGD
jgi:membrane protein involved in colicin uptake